MHCVGKFDQGCHEAGLSSVKVLTVNQLLTHLTQTQSGGVICLNDLSERNFVKAAFYFGSCVNEKANELADSLLKFEAY